MHKIWFAIEVNENQAVQMGDLEQITSLILNDGGDLEFRDALDRNLNTIAQMSELLLPAQKDAVRDLLLELPGRLAVQMESESFTGLKMNANAAKHKHAGRNRQMVGFFEKAIQKGSAAQSVKSKKSVGGMVE